MWKATGRVMDDPKVPPFCGARSSIFMEKHVMVGSESARVGVHEGMRSDLTNSTRWTHLWEITKEASCGIRRCKDGREGNHGWTCEEEDQPKGEGRGREGPQRTLTVSVQSPNRTPSIILTLS